MKRCLWTLAMLATAVAATVGDAVGQDKYFEKISEALPDKAPAQPKGKRKVLVYSKTAGFRHSSIPVGAKAFVMMGDKTGAYTAVATEDPSYFHPDTLNQFDAVVMLNTTGDCLKPAGAPKKPKDPEDQAAQEQYKKDLAKYEADKAKSADLEALYKKSLHDFVKKGKGLMGTHSATDTYHRWDAYNKMMGGTFAGHPWHTKVPVKNLQPSHPLNAPFNSKDFEIADEIYQFRNDTAKPNERIFLLALDAKAMDVSKGSRDDGVYPVSWVATYGDGRTFYCSLGHREEIYFNPTILRHYLAGLQYVLGDLPAPATATPTVSE